VLAAHDLEPAAARLEDALGVGRPFHDDGVARFGLCNAVYAVGDTFIEIVSPLREGTAAGRYLDRRGGDCGYMAMFQLGDAVVTRHRLHDLGVRIVWDTTHDDIVDIHLHPKDVPGAIVALDVADPPGSWRWAGPDWTGQVPHHGAGGLTGLTVASSSPSATAQRWAEVLGVTTTEGHTIRLADGEQTLRFVEARDVASEGIVAAEVAAPGGGAAFDVAGVRFARVDLEG
jgi:hypothetical protein